MKKYTIQYWIDRTDGSAEKLQQNKSTIYAFKIHNRLLTVDSKVEKFKFQLLRHMGGILVLTKIYRKITEIQLYN
jgi:hypothetical protein